MNLDTFLAYAFLEPVSCTLIFSRSNSLHISVPDFIDSSFTVAQLNIIIVLITTANMYILT